MVTENRIRQKIVQGPRGEIITFPPDAVFNANKSIPPDIDLELTGTTQLFSLGTKLEDVWGRVFRYVEYGGTIAQASMVEAEAPDGAHDDLDIVAAVVGDTAVVTTTTVSLDVNEYAQGWLLSELLVSGIAYPIKSHLVYVTAAATIQLWIPIRTSIAADADISLVKSKYKEVIIAAAAAVAAVVGANAGTGAVDGRYGWVQTRGPAKVLTAGTAVIGEVVTVITTAGAIGPTGADDVSMRVGQVINVGPTTEWSLIDLQLE